MFTCSKPGKHSLADDLATLFKPIAVKIGQSISLKVLNRSICAVDFGYQYPYRRIFRIFDSLNGYFPGIAKQAGEHEQLNRRRRLVTTLEKLLVLQDRDRKLRQLLQETRDIPARKQLIESRLKANRDAHHLAQENLKKNSAQIKAVELEIDSVKETIKKYKMQQGQIKNNDQYRALEREIRENMQRVRELEEREIVLMEESESLKKTVAEREQALSQEDSVVQVDIKALDDRLKNIQAEVEEARKNRENMTQGIDDAWLSRYTRIFNNKGDYALVPVDNGTCGGCHMKVPPQLVQDAKRADTMVSCSYCGRLLYWMP